MLKARSIMCFANTSLRHWEQGIGFRSDLLISWNQTLLDQGRIHPKPQTLRVILDLHLGLALHGQNPLEEGCAKTLVLWLAHRRAAELPPFQMKLPGTLGLVYAPPDFCVSAWNRQSPIADGIRGEFMEGHTDWHRQISRKLDRWSNQHEARLSALSKGL